MCSTKPNAIQDLEVGRRQMGDQAEPAREADRGRRRLETGRNSWDEGSDIGLFRRPDGGQNGLPVRARARTDGGMLVGRRRSLVRAMRAASPLRLWRCFSRADDDAAEHAAPTRWKNQEDAGGQRNR
jgi:hypothetical protein